jgi:hypothetical protein
MCWYNSKELSPEISKEDIPVFKICKKSYDNKHVESKYKHFIYELGKLYTENVNPHISSEGEQIINEAFHSYDICLKTVAWAMMNNDDILVEGIIPKGSIYYLNMFGEIASDQIILKKIEK